MENQRYNKLSKYLKEKYGERVLKICIDGNFTCPNRDGTKSSKGCIFCSSEGSGEHIKEFIKNTSSEDNSTSNLKSTDLTPTYIRFQVENYFNSYKAQRANKFIVYFQNYTNTYDSIENLKNKYDSALIDKRIVGISVATRPDCITEEIAMLLSSYSSNYHVFVELGLQTSNDNTGKIINRGYTSKDFTSAVSILNKYNIDTIVHVMVGLPGENFEDLKNTILFINKHHLQGIKIHSTYVIKNTILEDWYNNGSYVPISLDDYMNSLVYILTHVNPNIIIHRISGDAPKDLLVAPSWNLHKKLVLNGLNKIFKEKDLYQGIYFNDI